MVYTVTLNPSIDYLVSLERLQPGEIHRAAEETCFPGGKGINVSLILHRLGIDTKIFGITAGATGTAIEEMLSVYPVQQEFIRLSSGNSRINVKIRSGIETGLNGNGPGIPGETCGMLMDKLHGLTPEDTLVLSGSIPSGTPPDIYEQLARCCGQNRARLAVDTTGDTLKNLLRFRPFLIKPNHHELGELFGTVIGTHSEALRYAGILQQEGARNVLVSMAEQGAVFLSEEGESRTHPGYPGRLENSVGAGDSMLAGFLAGWTDTSSDANAFALALAAGSATAFSPWLAEREDILRIYRQLTAEIQG